MKLKSTYSKLKSLIAPGIISCVFFAQPLLATANSFTGFSSKPGEEEPAKKAKARSFSSHNNSSVKIYPDIVKREMHVVAKNNEGKEVDFFVFDLNGTLVQNYKMNAKDHYRISGLARGTYVYRVFCGDEETAAGKFEIR